ncbi:DUF6894 family protein [Sphingomonas jaspsi]|uniref:DUF6894 family protein n=1 Tax=Sphingomonas jaspsi TaxID=392409 RepID=UPI00056AE88F|nr:hypothetical protein [Sphingomonas jaspsi]
MLRRPRRSRGLPSPGTIEVRYFFNVHAADGTIPDLVGMDLPHTEAAKEYADAHVVDLWQARILAGKPPYFGWLEVVDEFQRAVLKLPL